MDALELQGLVARRSLLDALGGLTGDFLGSVMGRFKLDEGCSEGGGDGGDSGAVAEGAEVGVRGAREAVGDVVGGLFGEGGGSGGRDGMIVRVECWSVRMAVVLRLLGRLINRQGGLRRRPGHFVGVLKFVFSAVI